MANIARWDPYGEMVTLRDAMDRLFENALIGPFGGGQQATSMGMPVDVTENDDNFMIRASIPGVKPEDVDVTVQGEIVTIKAQMTADEEEKNAQFHVRERRWGTFTRSVTLPVTVKADQVQAEYQNGVLTLTLPKADEVKPKRITIKGSQQKTIEGQAGQS